MSFFYPVVKQMVLPPVLILLLLIGGFLLVLLRWRSLGKLLLALGILLYYALSISPTADWLLRSLEFHYPPLAAAHLPRTGTLVVLGGGLAPATATPVSSRLSQSSIRRVLEAVRLYHLMDRPRIVLSGGRSNPGSRVSEAEASRQVLVSLGIPAKLILMEADSRNTFESARAIQRLKLHKPLILVTSARHMPRAMKVFKAAGMQPLPAPCDFQSGRGESAPLRFLPTAEALAASTGGIYEYLGSWWYEITGRY